MGRKDDLFIPELLSEFGKSIGMWPVGTIVVLSDGRIAIVREQNRKDISLPKVEAVYPQREKKFVNLKESQLSIHKYLNPFTEGEKYLSFI